ncbi:hypothetical protein AeNC1_019292, partial [Aphanomyces euteiches]
QAKPQPLTGINSPVYSSPNPVVFGIQYNLTGTNVQSYDLKAAEEIFKRGYGKDTSPISGQMGGYVFTGGGIDGWSSLDYLSTGQRLTWSNQSY